MYHPDQYVRLPRRILAYILDIFVFWSLVAIVFQVYPDHYNFYWAENGLSPADTTEYAVLLVYLIDQILGPVIFGRTITRWILGYKITRFDGDNPRIWQALVRFLSIAFLEVITLGLISLFTATIRQDRATLHDLLSGTRAIQPEPKTQQKRYRISLAVSSVVLASLYFWASAAYMAYDIFIVPQEITAEENGLFPERIYRDDMQHSETVDVKDMSVLPKKRYSEINLCEDDRSSYSVKYKLQIGEEKFTIDYRFNIEKLFLIYNPRVTPELGVSENIDGFQIAFARAVIHFLENYPFKSDNHEMAAWVTRYEDPQFSLFTPIKNSEYVVSKIAFVLMFPAVSDNYDLATYSIVDDDYYSFVMMVTADKAAILETYTISGGKVWRIDIRGRPEQPEVAHEMLVEMLLTLRPSNVTNTAIPQCVTSMK